jgi:hypothetical protein
MTYFSISRCKTIQVRLMNSKLVGLDIGTIFHISTGVKNADSKVVLPSKRIGSETHYEPQALKKSSRFNISDPFNQMEQTPQFNLLENDVASQPVKGPGCKHNCCKHRCCKTIEVHPPKEDQPSQMLQAIRSKSQQLPLTSVKRLPSQNIHDHQANIQKYLVRASKP